MPSIDPALSVPRSVFASECSAPVTCIVSPPSRFRWVRSLVRFRLPSPFLPSPQAPVLVSTPVDAALTGRPLVAARSCLVRFRAARPWVGGRIVPLARVLVRLAPRTAWARLLRPAPWVPAPPLVSGGSAIADRLHGNCLRAQSPGSEMVPIAISWHRHESTRFLLGAAYDAAVAAGVDGFENLDRSFAEVGDGAPLLRRAGENALAKRLEHARLYQFAGTSLSPASVRYLRGVVRRFHAREAGVNLTTVLDLDKYRAYAPALGSKPGPLAKATMEAWVQLADEFLAAHAALYRCSVAGAHRSVLAAVRERVRRAGEAMLRRGSNVIWHPTFAVQADRQALRGYVYLRTVELTLRDSAVDHGASLDDFWGVWRRYGLRPDWVEFVAGNGPLAIRRWLADPAVHARVSSIVADLHGYLRALGADYPAVYVPAATAYLGQRELVRAKHEMIMSNLRYASRRAKLYALNSSRVQKPEAKSAVWDGLTRAVDKFDYRMENTLCTYADKWMTQRLQVAYEETHIVRRSDTVSRCAAVVLRARELCQARGEVELTPERIQAQVWRCAAQEHVSAEEPELTGPAYRAAVDRIMATVDPERDVRMPNGRKPVRAAMVEEVLNFQADPMSLDRSPSNEDDEGGDFHEIITVEDPSSRPDAQVPAAVRTNLDLVLQRLEPAQEKVVRLAFGLTQSADGSRGHELELRDIALRLNERQGLVREHLQKGVRRLREIAEELFGPEQAMARLGLG